MRIKELQDVMNVIPSRLADHSSTYRHLSTRFDDRHGVLLRCFIAGTALISLPEKIAFRPRSYNGAEREGRKRKNIFSYQVKANLFYLLYINGVLLSKTLWGKIKML